MATDYFMKIDSIPGDTTDKSHPNEIKVTSWSWGETSSGAFGPGGFTAGKNDLQDFQFTASTSVASPLLFFNCAAGARLKSADFVARSTSTSPLEYLKVSLSDVLISSYQVAGNQADNVPVDHVSLDFAKITVTYTPQSPSGTPGTPVMKFWDKTINAGG